MYNKIKTLPFIYYFILTLLSSAMAAQEKTITVSQDEKLEQLMAEKRKINAANAVNDRYRIQIFSGDNESAKKNLNDYRKSFVTGDGTIIFNTPNYKVLIGNYKTRIEAERNLNEVKKKYPNALLIKPSRN